MDEGPARGGGAPAPPGRLDPRSAALEGGLPASFAGPIAVVAPAVVSVAASRRVEEALPDPLRELLEPFGGPGARDGIERGLGSGVIVDPDGTVLTNHHVVEGASRLTVRLSDGRELPAKVLGADARTDLAVLELEAEDLPYATLGDSDAVRVGDVLLALGDPFGLGPTASLGICSATGRGDLGLVDYEDFIQTDAAIHPGSSGGALFDLRGEVVGIPTAIVAGRLGGATGIGFAVPSRLAREVLAQIRRHGRVIRGFLGVSVQDLTPPLAEALGLPPSRGALVGSVQPESPAARAGLQPGDVVVALDGEALEHARELRLRVAREAPGREVALTVLREGRTREVAVRLVELPEDGRGATSRRPAPRPDGEAATLGLELAVPSAGLRARFGVGASARGVLVIAVTPGSRAAEAGLEAGDVVVEVDRRGVERPEQMRRAIARAGARPLVLLVQRGEVARFVLVPPEA